MSTLRTVREGFVTIHSDGDKYVCKGMDVAGVANGSFVKRTVLIPANSPAWVKELCKEYANTELKVHVRVARFSGPNIAYALPTSNSVEDVLDAHKQRYGTRIMSSSFDNAFKAHELCAVRENMKVIEHVKNGMMSYTIAEDVGGRKYRIVGGMLIGKVINRYSPDNEQWRQAFNSFVRIKKQ